MIKESNKILIFIILAVIIIFLGILFRFFILENILKPFALMLWLFLRIFILSIDQKIIWGLLIFAVIVFFIFRLSYIMILPANEDKIKVQNVYLNNLKLWQSYFSAKPHDPDEMKALKWTLTQMLVSIYASRKRIPVNFQLYDAFKQNEIQLPESIYSFLYDENKKNKWYDYRKRLQRLSKNEVNQYYQNLEESLHFLEKFLEIKDE